MAYEYKSTRPIAAFSMAEYEALTGRTSVANFGRGKDKTKRKSRKGLIAAGIAGAGALGAAARYGGAAINTRMGSRYLDRPKDKMSAQGYLKARKAAESGGAIGALGRDINRAKAAPGNAWNAAKSAGSKVKNYDYKGIPGRMGASAKAASGRAANVGKGLASLAMSRPKTVAGLGLAGAAGLAGAGYGAYKLMKGNKKKGK